MALRPARRLLAVVATIATSILLTSASAHATWREPGPTDDNWRCGAFSYLTELRFQDCAVRFRSTNVDYVQSVMLVTNTGSTPRAVSGNTETFAGAGRGRHLSYGDCGAATIPAGTHLWCYGKTEPVPHETPIYGIGELFQPGEYSFAYSPTPFTPPVPPAPPPPPGTCDDCDGDGYQLGVDCVDNGPTINPGSVDVPGNGIDEDCRDGDAPVPVLNALIAHGYEHPKRGTRITRLSVRPVRAGTAIRLRCTGRGCPFKTKSRAVTRDASRLNLLALMRRATLRPGTRLEIQVTKPGTIGRTRLLRMRTRRSPRVTDQCLTAGEQHVKCPL